MMRHLAASMPTRTLSRQEQQGQGRQEQQEQGRQEALVLPVSRLPTQVAQVVVTCLSHSSRAQRCPGSDCRGVEVVVDSGADVSVAPLEFALLGTAAEEMGITMQDARKENSPTGGPSSEAGG